MVCILHGYYNVHPKMRFSLSPPPSKSASVITSPTNMQSNYKQNNNKDSHASGIGTRSDDDISPGKATSNFSTPLSTKDAEDAASDYNQWLHAMKLVARLPGGMPPEFRRKLWLSLADKYLKSKNVDWIKEEEKCFCEKWREDDEELGIQIVKDLHRTGSNLCTGPAGSINQAKLKRILLGYARYNPEVGYCQGFNMLGALILQVMEKEEVESMKVMIYLVEGVLPPGYFHGSMGGLQADMAVFRELMQTKLPRLAKHLQKLQGPIENAYEPPLTNVFTMQWFLTLFCTCLPMTCVLRVWDLVLIEGSDVLLRTALVLWSLLEERVLSTRTADDFYGKMGSFSSELLNGHLIDSNGLIEKVVQLGPIPDIQRLRDKHLYNITPLRHKQGLQFYYDDEEPAGSDEESRLAVATVWGMPWARRGSQGNTSTNTATTNNNNTFNKQVTENKERLALDISLLKKQYDRLRERQRQAHIILTTACSTACQSATSTTQHPSQSLTVNQLLLGRPAIVTNKGRRIGPPPGAIPPARKPSLPTILHKRTPDRQLRRGETLHWQDTDISKRRRESLTWKEIKADRATLLREGADAMPKSQKLRKRLGKSDSSSYSEESDDYDADVGVGGSSSDTSLCDEDEANSGANSIENSPKRKSKSTRKTRQLAAKLGSLHERSDSDRERQRPKSWAPSSSEIPFMLMTADSPTLSGDDQKSTRSHGEMMKEEEDSTTECDRLGYKSSTATLDWPEARFSYIAGDLASTKSAPVHIETDVIKFPVITSTSQLSPMPDVTAYLNGTHISPLPTPKPFFLDSTNSLGSGEEGEGGKKFAVSDDGVTNQYFERVNSVERPTKLDLFYSLNEEEDGIRRDGGDVVEGKRNNKELEKEEVVSALEKVMSQSYSEKLCAEKNTSEIAAKTEITDKDAHRRMELLMSYSEKSSAAFIAEATTELSTNLRHDKTKNSSEADDLSYAVCSKTKNHEFENAIPAMRDDNIPGEASYEFIENSTKVDEEWKTYTPRSNNVVMRKPNAMSNACRKRRDPRRMTLTRSTTLDIEERFQAFERRLSEETKENMAEKEVKKIIPTTAELEKRLSKLEQQLSSDADERKRFAESSNLSRDLNTPHETTKLIKSLFTEIEQEIPLNTSFNENIALKEPVHPIDRKVNIPDVVPFQETHEPNQFERTHNHILLTTELEERFNAMERQMSSNGSPSKQSMDLRRVERRVSGEEAQTPPNTPSENNNKQELERGQSKGRLSNEIEKEQAAEFEAEEVEKPRLKKLPSTAELEDRFNALERRLSSQKSSPAKTKKEPPDEERGGGETHKKPNPVKSEKESPDEREARSKKTTPDEGGSKEKSAYSKRQEEKAMEVENEEEEIKVVAKDKVSPTEEKERKERQSKRETETGTTKRRAAGEDDTNQETKRNMNQASTENNKTVKKSDTTECEVEENTTMKTKDREREQVSESEVTNSVERRSKVKDEEKSTKKQADDDGAEEKSDRSNKRSPPSTEELEKRFKALEKQMSSTNLESNKNMENAKEPKKAPAGTSKERKSQQEHERGQTKSSKEVEMDTDSNKKKTQSQVATHEPTTNTKTMKSFEEKCKHVNKEPAKQTTIEPHKAEPKFVEVFNDKCKEINKELTKTTGEADEEEGASESKSEQVEAEKTRTSEPPSTEDLEKRFESLKQRMNTKSIVEKGFGTKSKANALVDEERQETQDLRLEAEKIVKRKFSEPPSTEDLESRFEALQRRKSEQRAYEHEKRQTKNKLETRDNIEIEDGKTSKQDEATKGKTRAQVARKERKEEEAEISEDKTTAAHIPAAPPMPSRSPGEPVINVEQHRALIEEFQSKIKIQPNGENVKPSDIKPNRRPTPERQRTLPFDGTSEAHANTAFFRSENYESSWYSQPHIMVRRFSDLPSRADLENRLHFLERQFLMKFYKQRCASDSEVASRKQFMDAKSLSAEYDRPSTSMRAQQQAADDLEKRVLALEKQLSENSLKLLEAVRAKQEQIQVTDETDTAQRLSTDTVDATGRELVRYVGEVEEAGGAMKPINISINIKMLLKKGEIASSETKGTLPTAAELEKRLEVLEQQLKISRTRREGSVDHQSGDRAHELKSDQERAADVPSKEVADASIKEAKEIKKVVKETLNEEYKSIDKAPEKLPKTPTEKVTKNITDEVQKKVVASGNEKEQEVEKNKSKIEASKAEKTLENQQIARSNKEIIENSETAIDEGKNKTSSKKKDDENDSQRKVEISKDEMPEMKQTKHEREITNQVKCDNEDEEKRMVKKDETDTEKQDVSKESTEAYEVKLPKSADTSGTPTQTVIQVGSSDPNKKPLVLLLDNEPKAVKVRRLTRANTEELENLFQALEKQLSERNLIKSEDGKLTHATAKQDALPTEESKALTQLSKEIEDYTKADRTELESTAKNEKGREVLKTPPPPPDDFDWGLDPVKRHLKRKTAHLPSTKELESRFRSLERQIKLLEDVEKIDVEQRLSEIERKIKLQYSLSHEKDLTKFLELCEGKGLDELPDAITAARDKYQPEEARGSRTPTPKQARSPYTSPSRAKEKTPPYISPAHTPRESRSPKRYVSPGRVRIQEDERTTSKSPKKHTSPGRVRYEEPPHIPTTEDLEYRFRALELPRSKSKESLKTKTKKNYTEKSLIHPIEMLLDPSSDEDAIPSTGELEHRMRVLEERKRTTSPAQHRSGSRSPTIEDIKNKKLIESQQPRTPIHNLEKRVVSPTKKELPTADELEARMYALEQDQRFDFKMQKSYEEFNEKLKKVISPSLSFEELKAMKSREQSPRRSGEANRATTPKSALRESASSYDDMVHTRSVSPKSIRFRDEEEDDYMMSMSSRPKSRAESRDTREGRMTLADSCSSLSTASAAAHVSEGVDEFGSRMMRETSPLQRTGSHTGVPLRTNDNINERLDSIKNTIKSIDTLCEEKPYRKERCQRYINSLFSDSIHFASKKTSLEDLSRSESRIHRDYTPSIRVSDHSYRQADYLYGRTVGSADSLRSTSPLRAASPLHHRSNRDIRREISPRRRREEEREEYQSRFN
ncbi:microtubule-associated protein futsch isoform X2 [Eurosta solidaginis]|uniref:microtubule-associated protein futsch isoform X2 n=1 Tax=Eurosta solidaginis TaxID=178769 RepID=UPI0035313DF6